MTEKPTPVAKIHLLGLVINFLSTSHCVSPTRIPPKGSAKAPKATPVIVMRTHRRQKAVRVVAINIGTAPINWDNPVRQSMEVGSREGCIVSLSSKALSD